MVGMQEGTVVMQPRNMPGDRPSHVVIWEAGLVRPSWLGPWEDASFPQRMLPSKDADRELGHSLCAVGHLSVHMSLANRQCKEGRSALVRLPCKNEDNNFNVYK